MPEETDLHVDQFLTNMSVKYMNEELIADKVLPIVSVNKRSNKYPVYRKRDGFRLVDASIGPKSQANEMDWEVGSDNYSVNDYALADYVPLEDIDNADVPLMPRADTNDIINEWLRLGREVRVAKLIFNGGTYPDGNKKDLSAATQWGADGDNPIDDVQTAVERCFMRANKLVFGHEAWIKFRALPEVLDAVKSSSRMQDNPGGLATRMEIAELFEVDEVLVGRAWVDNGKRGKAADFKRAWANHMAALHVRAGAGLRTVTFGKSFMEQTYMTQTMIDLKRGVKGAEYIKVGYNCDEKIVAADLGYFLENVVPEAA